MAEEISLNRKEMMRERERERQWERHFGSSRRKDMVSKNTF